mmetsp:Transcript_51542/g.82336  ORF Transcript_51542/g.82336 Transcript_51542/m.82336 type:complete len:221 (-) Transcript_51542:344-1006(-)
MESLNARSKRGKAEVKEEHGGNGPGQFVSHWKPEIPACQAQKGQKVAIPAIRFCQRSLWNENATHHEAHNVGQVVHGRQSNQSSNPKVASLQLTIVLSPILATGDGPTEAGPVCAATGNLQHHLAIAHSHDEATDDVEETHRASPHQVDPTARATACDGTPEVTGILSLPHRSLRTGRLALLHFRWDLTDEAQGYHLLPLTPTGDVVKFDPCRSSAVLLP